MKKLFAILLSMLLLCSVAPFAAVSADYDVPTVVIGTEETEVNAGDKFEVTVNFEGLADTAGLISVMFDLGFDPDVFEIQANWDEDEEMWIPEIEIGNKYNASSNKYIMMPAVDEETGICKKSTIQYLRATATETQVRREAHFCTYTLTVKEDAYSGTYELGVANYNPKNFVCYGLLPTDMVIETTSIVVNGTERPHECNFVGTVTTPATCTEPGEMTYACTCGEGTYTEEIPAAHTLEHHQAVIPNNCKEEGTYEHWICSVCNGIFIDAEGNQEVSEDYLNYPGKHVDVNGVALDPCVGGFCAHCQTEIAAAHEYRYGCDKHCINCGEKTNPRATHNIIHVDAVPATSCIESGSGNVEYWYCDLCNSVALDENLMQTSNLKDVITFAPCVSEIPCRGGVCLVCGMDVSADDHAYLYDCDTTCEYCGEETRPEAVDNHIYDDEYDVDCNNCGNIRVASAIIVTFNGNAVSDEINGLAFRFDVKATDVVVDGAELKSALVAPFTDGEGYELAYLGALVSNKANANMTVDSDDCKDVEAVYLCGLNRTDGVMNFAIRVIKIPHAALGMNIQARPYLVYEKDGVEVLIYGDIETSSYNDAAN